MNRRKKQHAKRRHAKRKSQQRAKRHLATVATSLRQLPISIKPRVEYVTLDDTHFRAYIPRPPSSQQFRFDDPDPPEFNIPPKPRPGPPVRSVAKIRDKRLPDWMQGLPVFKTDKGWSICLWDGIDEQSQQEAWAIQYMRIVACNRPPSRHEVKHPVRTNVRGQLTYDQWQAMNVKPARLV